MSKIVQKGVRLETDRLIIRQVTLDDADAMFKNWASDPEVARFMPYEAHTSVDQTEKIIVEWLEHYRETEKNKRIVLAIVLKITGELIGSIDYVETDIEAKAAEVGYQLGKQWWHNGYAVEALKALLKYCFEECGFNRIWAMHNALNVNSGAVMRKSGMKYEGTFRKDRVRKGMLRDSVQYAILAEDYFGKLQKGWNKDMVAKKQMNVRLRSNVIDNNYIFRKVEDNINYLANQNVSWSIPVSHEEIEKVRNGVININISGNKSLPRDWFPLSMKGIKILCLAGAGGQQAPICAAAGADVTVLDLSENMLLRDKGVAEQEGLFIKIEQGNMCNMSRFADDSFDIIINPASLFYVPDVTPVYQECFRTLKKGGIFIMCAPNPTNYLCEYIQEGDYYIACNKLPYKSYEHDNQGDWIEFGHTLDDYIGGLTRNGFVITGFFEDGYDENSNAADFLETCFVIRSIK